MSDSNKLASALVANNPEIHIAFAPQAQISSSKSDAHHELCNGVISCVLNIEDTEVPCNDDADFTLSSRSLFPVSSRNEYKILGIKAYYLHLEEKHDSSDTIPSKEAVYKGEKHDFSETISSKKEVYQAEYMEETPDSSGTIQSNILSDLGINLPFIKRGD
ncbi:hypothetical protein AgCh_005846 [Apium graveolens]